MTTWPDADAPTPGALVEALAGDLLEMSAANSGGRIVVGIAGAPGSGKSTLASLLSMHLGPTTSAVVPMDGFHLADAVLRGRGIRDRKGAIDTFDACGYVALLARVVAADDPVVYAPMYMRGLEEPIAGAIPVPREIPIVLTEGNYLLVPDPPWAKLRDLATAIWYVDIPNDIRQQRLQRRHEEHGMPSQEARAWTVGPDEENARLIASTRDYADRIVTWT